MATVTSTSGKEVPAAANITNKKSVAEQKNMFLKILTTQLQNQNPLDPMKPAEFTSQLTQYSQLEQQLDTNTKLDTLITNASKSVVSPLSYLNTTVDYFSDTAPVQDGNATWSYAVTGATSVDIRVEDSSGATVYTGTGDISNGAHNFTLPSTLANGTPLKMVITAKDGTGKVLDHTINARAKINAVNTVDGSTILEASGYFLSSDLVTRIATSPASTTL
jgi:flagellar basal-body rod modification protein FlgD